MAFKHGVFRCPHCRGKCVVPIHRNEADLGLIAHRMFTLIDMEARLDPVWAFRIRRVEAMFWD